MSYEGFVSIMLTALGVMLAVLAIIIAILAFVGYAGFKDAIRASVAEHVKPAMDQHFKEYPEASKFIQLYQDIQSLYLIYNKLAEPPQPKTVAPASNTGVQEEKAKPAPAEPEPPVAKEYPGEEQSDGSDSTKPPTDTDGGADHS